MSPCITRPLIISIAALLRLSNYATDNAMIMRFCRMRTQCFTSIFRSAYVLCIYKAFMLLHMFERDLSLTNEIV